MVAATARPLLRISLVTETWPPEINGVAMTLSRLVGGLAARGHEVQVVRPRQAREGGACAVDHPLVSELVRPGLPIPGYNALRLGLPSAAALERSWRNRRPDVVHVATEGPLGYSALAAASRLGLPATSSYHTNFDDYARHYRLGFLRGAFEGWLRSFHNRTRLTLAPSADLVQRLSAAGYHGCVLWSRGVDIETFTPARRDPGLRRSWGAGDGDLVCLHVGRVAPEKDIPLALEAWRAVAAARPGSRMVVAGDGPIRAALARGCPEAVFTGVLPLSELGRAYASADLLLFPSLSETFGNVLCEGMASGLAAVGYDYAAAAMHGRDGANMVKLRCGDRAGFIAAAVALALDDARRRRLGQAARETMLGNAWSPVVDRFENLLRDVAERDRSSALEALCS